MKRILIVFVLLPLLLASAALALFWHEYNRYIHAPLPLLKEQVLNVAKGTGFNRLLRQLEVEQLIDRPLYLKLYGRHSGKAAAIKAGEYLIQPGTTPLQLIDQLVAGKSISYSFTVVEGTAFRDLLRDLAADPVLRHDAEGLSEDALLQRLGLEYESGEGLFLAETYSFQRGATDLDILHRAHELLRKTLDEAWQQRPAQLPYRSPYEALIMASIVEKETARADERPLIAGVFVRRLDQGMRLQTDPTVIYGLGDAYDGNLRRADLRRPTPYNTYVIPGLPPTPIALVGPEAIRAALNPEDGKALYFVARGDGSHQFSATLSEHNAAVRKYQLQRRKDYRSSP